MKDLNANTTLVRALAENNYHVDPSLVAALDSTVYQNASGSDFYVRDTFWNGNGTSSDYLNPLDGNDRAGRLKNLKHVIASQWLTGEITASTNTTLLYPY